MPARGAGAAFALDVDGCEPSAMRELPSAGSRASSLLVEEPGVDDAEIRYCVGDTALLLEAGLGARGRAMGVDAPPALADDGTMGDLTVL